MNNPYRVYTMQIGQWRLAQQLGIPMLDITVKSGIRTFAPTWDNLMAYKQGLMDNDEYSCRYLDKVIPSLQTHPEVWERLKEHRTFALACYCKAGNFCHRNIFAALAVTYLQGVGETVLFEGELLPS